MKINFNSTFTNFFKKYLWFIVALIFAAALRIYNFTAISLWHDEAFSALLIRYPWQEMLNRLAVDAHPPLYYIALRFWHYLFGDTVTALRSFSVFFGVLTVWAIWFFVKEVFKNQKMALWSAFFVALSPFVIEFSTEARMYNFGAFFTVMAAYFLVCALRKHKEHHELEKLNMPNNPNSLLLHKKYLQDYFWFALCMAVVILTHYYLLFTAACLGFYGVLYLVIHFRKIKNKNTASEFISWFGPLFASFLITFLFFLPWLPAFLAQTRSVVSGYWIPQISVWSVPATFWTFLLSIGHDVTKNSTQVGIIVISIFVLIFYFRFLKKNPMPEKWLVFLLSLAPFFGALAFALLAKLKGSESSVYQERYFLYGSLFFFIVLGGFLSELRAKLFAAIVFVCYCIFNLAIYNYNWKVIDPSHRPGMAAAAKYLGSNVAPGDKVISAVTFEFFNYKYYEQTYFPTPVEPVVYSKGRDKAKDMTPIEGLALLSDSDLSPAFETGTTPGQTVWLIWTNGFWQTKPQMPLSWVQINEKEYPDALPNVGDNIYVTTYKVK